MFIVVRVIVSYLIEDTKPTHNNIYHSYDLKQVLFKTLVKCKPVE